MLQVSIQRLDRLLVGLIGLDVLVELLHVRIEAGRVERRLRERWLHEPHQEERRDPEEHACPPCNTGQCFSAG